MHCRKIILHIMIGFELNFSGALAGLEKMWNFPGMNLNLIRISLQDCKISLQFSIFSLYFLCISLFQRQQFPSKWQNFPAMRFPNSQFFPGLCFGTSSKMMLLNFWYSCFSKPVYMYKWLQTSMQNKVSFDACFCWTHFLKEPS